MWSGSIIDTHDGCNLVNFVFQSRHLNKIIVGLENPSPFKKLHWKNKENLITSAIWASGSFFIHEKKLWKLNDGLLKGTN
jgi:hypothetical protein